MSKTYDEWLKYYENITKEQVIFDMMLDMQEIEKLNNIINELEKYFEQEGFWHSLDKIKELKGSNGVIPPETIGTNGEDGGLFDYGDR